MEELPEHLGHKPAYAIPYASHDGIYAGKTDVRYLSVGLAQYDPSKVSVKVMRHTGTRWSRQSEELPVHRVVDMTLLVAKCLFASDEGTVSFTAGSFERQSRPIELAEDSHRDEAEMASFYAFLEEHGPQLKRRLNVLADTLTQMRQAGKL